MSMFDDFDQNAFDIYIEGNSKKRRNPLGRPSDDGGDDE